MASLESMKIFGLLDTEDKATVDIKSNETKNHETPLHSGARESTMEKKSAVLSRFKEVYSDKLCNYVTEHMTAKELCMYEEAFLLEERNPKRLSSLDLSEKQLEQMVKGFRQYIDVAEQVQSGITDEELDSFLFAVKKGIPLKNLFTEDGRFIDYEKIKKICYKLKYIF